MNIGDALEHVLPYIAALGGLGGLALMVKSVLENRRLWPKSKAEAENITAAARDKDWARFQREIGRLVRQGKISDDRAERAERRAEAAHEKAEEAIEGFRACEDREVHLKGRVAELEAINRGRGQVAQEAATMLAAERIVERQQARQSE